MMNDWVVVLDVSVSAGVVDTDEAVAVVTCIVPEYVLRVFEHPKNMTFYVFLKRHFKRKRKKRNPKIPSFRTIIV